MRKNKKAFTLFELLLVLGMLSATILFFVPLGIEQLRQNSIESVAREIASEIFKQQQKAYVGFGDTPHGVELLSNGYNIFNGISTDNAAIVENVPIPNNVNISNVSLSGAGNEFFFQKGDLTPSIFGSFDVVGNSRVFRVIINSQGAIDVIEI